MNFEEVDNALEELETRLERLRALYEQYFLGFEKIEPTVPRKDVDRRIYLLRREKIRNTGRRFKLQTLIQRYNTFQQYWQRVCREIENGTYRRHLLRAERRMNPDQQLTIATRRRFGKALALAQQAAAAAASETGANQALSERPAAPDTSADEDDAVTLRPPPPRPRGAPATSSSPPPSSRRPRTAPATSSPPPPSPPHARGASEEHSSSRPSPGDRSFESLDLDMGFLGSSRPGSAGAPRSGKAAAQRSSPKAATSPEAKSSPKAATSPEAKSSPKAAPGPGAAAKAVPPPKPARPPVPDAKSSPRTGSSEKRKSPPPPRPAAAKPTAAAAPASSIDDRRVKELHQKLTDMKKQNNESGQVSLEGLARTLRDTETKLRSQHKNRKIDFDIVIRDGKAIVKPTVR